MIAIGQRKRQVAYCFGMAVQVTYEDQLTTSGQVVQLGGIGRQGGSNCLPAMRLGYTEHVAWIVEIILHACFREAGCCYQWSYQRSRLGHAAGSCWLVLLAVLRVTVKMEMHCASYCRCKAAPVKLFIVRLLSKTCRTGLRAKKCAARRFLPSGRRPLSASGSVRSVGPLTPLSLSRRPRCVTASISQSLVSRASVSYGRCQQLPHPI
jgi:hypothetical protein